MAKHGLRADPPEAAQYGPPAGGVAAGFLVVFGRLHVACSQGQPDVGWTKSVEIILFGEGRGGGGRKPAGKPPF